MEKVTLRALLLFLLGGFLLLSGVFMDATGRQIKSQQTNGIGWHLNPLALVGRFVLSVGAVMLVASGILVFRARLRSKSKRSFYERASTNPGQTTLEQGLPASFQRVSQPPQQSRLQTGQAHQAAPSIQMTTYSTPLGHRSTSSPRISQLRGSRDMSTPSPSETMLSQYSSTLGVQNPRYSGMRISPTHPLGFGTSGAQRYSFTPVHSSPRESPSPSSYSSTGHGSRYSTLPVGKTLDTPEYTWRSHLTKEQTRTTPSSPKNDDPPPYESQAPPPYYP